MANATADLVLRPYGRQGRVVQMPVDDSQAIRKGTLVSQLAASGMVVPTTTALSGGAIGVALHGVAAGTGKRVDIDVDCVYVLENDGTNAVSEADPLGCPLFATDDHTVSDTQLASEPVAGYFFGLEPDSRVRVYVPLSGAIDEGGIVPGTSYQLLRTNAGATASEWGEPMANAIALPAHVGNDVIPVTIVSGAVYTIPALDAASTITLPAAATDGTYCYVIGDGVLNDWTIQIRDATGPTNITAAVGASKRLCAFCVKVAGAWYASVHVSP